MILIYPIITDLISHLLILMNLAIRRKIGYVYGLYLSLLASLQTSELRFPSGAEFI